MSQWLPEKSHIAPLGSASNAGSYLFIYAVIAVTERCEKLIRDGVALMRQSVNRVVMAEYLDHIADLRQLRQMRQVNGQTVH